MRRLQKCTEKHCLVPFLKAVVHPGIASFECDNFIMSLFCHKPFSCVVSVLYCSNFSPREVTEAHHQSSLCVCSGGPTMSFAPFRCNFMSPHLAMPIQMQLALNAPKLTIPPAYMSLKSFWPELFFLWHQTHQQLLHQGLFFSLYH